MERHSFEQPEKAPRRITEIEQLEKGMRIVFCRRLTGERITATVEHVVEDEEYEGKHYLVVRYLSGENEGTIEQVELGDWNVPELVFSGGYGGEGWIEMDVNQKLAIDPDKNMSAEFGMSHNRPREYSQYEAAYNKRPKPEKGQIIYPGEINEGDYLDLYDKISFLFPKFATVRVLSGPRRDPEGRYYIEAAEYDDEHQIVRPLELENYGVVPYGNGEWEKKRYMTKSKKKLGIPPLPDQEK